MQRKIFECCLLVLCMSLFAFAQEEPAPPAPEVFNPVKAVMSANLTTAKGKKVKGSEVLAGKKFIAFYFSAHWCGPCRAFTPELVKFRDKCAQKGLPFEVVFVSSDKTENDMFNYMKEADMKWYALPYGSKVYSEIQNHFKVGGIPHLTLLNGKGKVVSDNARWDVAMLGLKAYERWQSPNYKPLTYDDFKKKTQKNDTKNDQKNKKKKKSN